MVGRPQTELRDLARSFLDGECTARHLVRQIDDLVAGDRLAAYPHAFQRLVDALQDDLSLYVADSVTRAEAPGIYIDGAELRGRVEKFYSDLTSIDE